MPLSPEEIAANMVIALIDSKYFRSDTNSERLSKGSEVTRQVCEAYRELYATVRSLQEE